MTEYVTNKNIYKKLNVENEMKSKLRVLPDEEKARQYEQTRKIRETVYLHCTSYVGRQMKKWKSNLSHYH